MSAQGVPNHAALFQTRPGPSASPGAFQRILVALDVSAPAQNAVEVALRLADSLHARVNLLHVVDMALGFSTEYVYAPLGETEDLRAAGNALLHEAESKVPQQVAAECTIAEGDPATEIVAAARAWGADLIVIGTHGRGRLAHFLLGSTAESVVRHAPCPVLTVGHVPGPAGRGPLCGGNRS